MPGAWCGRCEGGQLDEYADTGDMIVMLDTNSDLGVASREVGYEVEQLITPLTGFLPTQPDKHFAIDNGAYSHFNANRYRAILQREKPRRELCRFVAAPDVVGSARRTLEVFDHWREELTGWPIALVMQDGQESLAIPWNRIQAVFIGGSTHWKESKHATHIIKCAQIMGKWVHVGRVNSPARFKHFNDLGVDSCDGSGLARYSHMRERIRDHEEATTLFNQNGHQHDYAEST